MKKAFQEIQEKLQNVYPAEEIRSLTLLVLESVCQVDRPILLRDKERILSSEEQSKINNIVAELQQYRPIQYILGETEFYGLPFFVNENVLIPRPETEELVERVIGWVHGTRCAVHEKLRVLDIGTGSGCIAIALAKHLPDAEVFACDISEQALDIARKNAELNKVKVNFFQQDVMSSEVETSTAKFDIIISNPPYIVPSEKAAMLPNVLAYEPHTALFVPEDRPLLFYERIAELGFRHLTPNGQLFFETGSLFGKDVAAMLQQKGYNDVELFLDLAGKDRIVGANLCVCPSDK
jgi:release factor glutamine methyltransferase